jgi:hypothetical protein
MSGEYRNGDGGDGAVGRQRLLCYRNESSDSGRRLTVTGTHFFSSARARRACVGGAIVPDTISGPVSVPVRFSPADASRAPASTHAAVIANNTVLPIMLNPRAHQHFIRGTTTAARTECPPLRRAFCFDRTSVAYQPKPKPKPNDPTLTNGPGA